MWRQTKLVLVLAVAICVLGAAHYFGINVIATVRDLAETCIGILHTMFTFITDLFKAT
ncbi:MAG TPA: hypothetical protein VFM10_13415 [Terriglobales bacterium]|nr:hypothetical protein [Terriglobales bacterium]